MSDKIIHLQLQVYYNTFPNKEAPGNPICTFMITNRVITSIIISRNINTS